jgi:transcriptional regulator CtsR
LPETFKRRVTQRGFAATNRRGKGGIRRLTQIPEGSRRALFNNLRQSADKLPEKIVAGKQHFLRQKLLRQTMNPNERQRKKI